MFRRLISSLAVATLVTLSASPQVAEADNSRNYTTVRKSVRTKTGNFDAEVVITDRNPWTRLRQSCEVVTVTISIKDPNGVYNVDGRVEWIFDKALLAQVSPRTLADADANGVYGYKSFLLTHFVGSTPTTIDAPYQLCGNELSGRIIDAIKQVRFTFDRYPEVVTVDIPGNR